jgi:hypothetical protein
MSRTNSLRTADAILDEGAALTWRMILMPRKRCCAALDLSTLINRDRKLARPRLACIRFE